MLFGGYVSLDQRFPRVEFCISKRKWHKERESRSFCRLFLGSIHSSAHYRSPQSCSVNSSLRFCDSQNLCIFTFWHSELSFSVVRRTTFCILFWIDVGLQCSRVTTQR
ncbi:hypothetical protein BC567DRAFT_95222 [Phyllosticta citribraziliensis]